MPLYHAEDIVEVVRHAARELADGFHLLGLPELLLHLVEGGHVAEDAEKASRVSELERQAMDVGDERAAVLALNRDPRRQRLLAGELPLERFLDHGQIGWRVNVVDC